MKVDVILGLQWGDEGKGKIVDVFTPLYDVIARFQGGPNAGHTIEFDGMKFILHTIPSGIFHRDSVNVIGNGVIIDPYILMKEVDELHQARITPEENLLISRRAHLILPTHRVLDAAYESAKGSAKIGSTLKGIGPSYTDKYARCGLRIGNIGESGFQDRYNKLKTIHLSLAKNYSLDISLHKIDGFSFEEYEEKWFEAITRMKDFRLIDSEIFLNRSLDEGKSVLAEGAQGTLLDIDFGSYPFVTSSSTSSGGVCSGLGISPHRIGTIWGVFKAYCTRVGSGPFPTELNDSTGELMRSRGHEYGSTTGRPRRCGWLDLPALNYSILINGIDKLIMMKADVLNPFENIRVCTGYKIGDLVTDNFPFNLSGSNLQPVYQDFKGWNDIPDVQVSFADLPQYFSEYIGFIEKNTGLPVEIISVGPDRTQTLRR